MIPKLYNLSINYIKFNNNMINQFIDIFIENIIGIGTEYKIQVN